ncbi:Os04g0255525 [Oryza sativa Japonica Group]|uniref:Os04g0255525 protein n=1 Tax=Oryza sativa subsp. japonica TaxID=39947 RepID=A0A0N7KIQ6_ORYSJ|nr:Os04g0255525 [Oryza sativa Japonica Group]
MPPRRPFAGGPPHSTKSPSRRAARGPPAKFHAPPRRPFAGGPPHSTKSPSRRAARGPPANFVDGHRPRANGRLPRHFRRSLGGRFGRRLLPLIFKMENYFCKTFNKKNYK